jgi:hypothetical protein
MYFGGGEMKETNIIQEIRLEASRLGLTLWRNNTGKFQDKNGRWVTYGLCLGSADLIGIYNSRFVAIEVKQPGKKPKPEQELFLNIVKKNGGIAGVLTDASQLEDFLKNN